MSKSNDLPLTPNYTLAERLAQARQKRFIGRNSELELLRSALLDPTEFPFAVLHLYGPGGVGKTALLKQYQGLATEIGVCCYYLDGRNFDPSPDSFSVALQLALGVSEAVPPLEALAAQQRYVLLIDTYEAITSLDTWLRERFLPQLPAQSLVVIAGRNPPVPAWYSELGWQDLVRVVELGNLPLQESQAYLSARGVAQNQLAAALEFTHGHPLALSLVADLFTGPDSEPMVDFNLEQAPDIVQVLLERFLDQVPDPTQRQALEICALSRTTTESLLEQMVGSEASRLFSWLRTLSFIEQGPYGLFPHDLARQVIERELRWRNPDNYLSQLHKLREVARHRAAKSTGMELQRARLDFVFLLRNTPYMKGYLDWKSFGEAYSAPACSEDFEPIVEMVLHHEGEASAQIARHWLQRQPEAFVVFRNMAGQLIGFLANLALHLATPGDLAMDPGAKAALDYISQHRSLRPGEEVIHHRFWMGHESYKAISSALNLTVLNCAMLWATRPKLGWTFITIADTDQPLWDTHFSYLNFWRAYQAEFEIDNKPYIIYTHDWGAEPYSRWRVVVDQREFESEIPTILKPSQAASLKVLSQGEFKTAVRQALTDYNRPAALAANPLLQTRLVSGKSSRGNEVKILQDLLRQAIESLKTNPRDQKLYRALWRTYFEPAATQELAAESLGLPFSTYRYHLANGIERIVNWLWQLELSNLEN